MRLFGVALILVSLLCLGCGAGEPGGSRHGPDPSSDTTTADAASGPPTATIRASGGKEVEVRVEIADGFFEMSRGLMGRTALAEDRGMLFVYEDEGVRSFWMKDTLIPLSIAFMDSEGRIVDIQDMKPLDDEAPHYVSERPARYALEVNKGFFKERGVEVGDKAELPV